MDIDSSVGRFLPLKITLRTRISAQWNDNVNFKKADLEQDKSFVDLGVVMVSYALRGSLEVVHWASLLLILIPLTISIL